MRIVFAGTPEFARVALKKLLDEGFDVAAVLTQPDRPAGRGMKLMASPVKQLATEHQIPVLQPQTLKHPVIQEQIRAYKPDVMVVVAYGLLLPQEVLDIPEQGCLNIHASLLPRWRGAAPIQRAIEAGDEKTGITIMQMDEGLDTGHILVSEPLDIAANETAGSLHDRLAELGAEMLNYALKRMEQDQLTPTPQATLGVTYAQKISKEETLIDWTRPASCLARQIRAFDPCPGMHTRLDGQPLKIWAAQSATGSGAPGMIIGATEGRLTVACGEGALDILAAQVPGGKRLDIKNFLHGHPLKVGTRLGS